MNTMKKAVAGLALVAAGYAPVVLADVTWNLDIPVSGTTPTTSFMTATFSDIVGGVALTLTASGLTVGPPPSANQFVRDFYFNIPASIVFSALTFATAGGTQTPVPSISTAPITNAAGNFDVALNYATGSGNRFVSGETSIINITGGGIGASSFANWSAVLAGGNSYGAAATLGTGTPMIAAIPEPETYAMMIIGLGLMGWMARRRRQALQPDPV